MAHLLAAAGGFPGGPMMIETASHNYLKFKPLRGPLKTAPATPSSANGPGPEA